MNAPHDSVPTPSERLSHLIEHSAPWHHRAAHSVPFIAVVLLVLFAVWVLVGLLAGSGATEIFQVHAEKIREFASPFWR